MMRADFPVVLDACVLAAFPVCDIFLRLAETPRLYIPKWSEEILAETHRTHLFKFEWPKERADSFRSALAEAFPDACISGYEALLPSLDNHPKDRHVLAAAIRGKVEVIVTFNLKDFKASSLEPWGVRAVHPSDYLITLHGIDPIGVIQRLNAIARKKNTSVERVLIILSRHVPAFCQVIIDELGIFNLPDL